jgi:hypothetical protein
MPRRLQAMKDVVACEKLRGAGKRALIRRYPNGATQPAMVIPKGRRTWRTETSKYPQEKKSTEIPKVVASEIGEAISRYYIETAEQPGKVDRSW